jgi:hypothetical protein
VLVFIAPVLLGDGVPLFRSDGGTNVRLTPVPGETRTGTGRADPRLGAR